MSLEVYPVPVESPAEARVRLSRFMERPLKEYEFAADNIEEAISFAVIGTIDAVAPVISALTSGLGQEDRVLASGWSYRRVDLKSATGVDIMFTSPGDPREGFILRVKPSRVFADELEQVSAYLFTDRKFWYPVSLNKVTDGLKKGSPRPCSFEHRPQYPSAERLGPPMAHSPGRPSDPESVLAILPPLLEALSAFDPALYAECLSRHASIGYKTLFEDEVDILVATRSVMALDGNVAGPSFARMVDRIWRAGMAADLGKRLADIDGLSALLVNQGNVSRRKEYDFDDDRCGAWVKQDESGSTVVFRHERDAMAILRTDDRLVISAVDYKTGETFETYVDIELEGGAVVSAKDTQPLRSHVTGLLRRWLHEIEGLGEEMEDELVTSPAPAF